MSDQSSTNGNAEKTGASGSVDQAPASATERAHAMRATLSARSEAEALLAEASQARRTAATDAETMVAEAEALAEQLVSEAQEVVAKANDEARERAEGILSRARAEAGELTTAAEAEVEELHRTADDERAQMRAEVRAELHATRERSVALAADIESQIGSLRPTLDKALEDIAGVMGTVEKLREEASAIELLEKAAVPQQAAAPAAGQAQGRAETPAATADEDSAPAGSWASAAYEDSVHDAEVIDDEEISADDAEDGELVDHAPSGNRVPAVAQAREVPAIRESDEQGDPGTRPLGWLFRAAQN